MDNQQFTPQPELPTPQHSPVSKVFSYIKRNKILVVIGLGLVLITIGILLTIIDNKAPSGSGQNNNQSNNQFKNWLKPTKELQVGEFRYVSPCQALTVDSTTNIFGNFADDGFVSEDFADESYTTTNESDSLKVACRYELKNDKYSAVNLEAEQFGDITQARKVFNFVVAKPDALKAKVDTIAAQQVSDTDAKAFVTQLQDAATKYPELTKLTYNTQELSRTNTDGLVFPRSTKGYVYFYQNTAYILEISPKDRSTKDTDLTTEYAKAFKSIAANIKKTDLDQSPAPTVIGRNDVVTSATKVIEPCVILTREAFTSVTGSTQDSFTSRTSLQYELKDIVQDKQRMVASQCERRSGRDAKTASNRITLTLRHASSVEGAVSWLQEGQGTTALTTTADQSFILNPRFEGDYAVYYFRVGPYVADVDITQTTSDGTFSGVETKEASREQYIQAINLLAAELRKYQ